MMDTSTLRTVLVILYAFMAATAVMGRPLITTNVRNPVRSGPSAEYARITVLPAGVRVEAIEKEGDWYRLHLSDTLQAWTYAENVRETDAEGPTTARLTDMSVTPEDGYTRVLMYLTHTVPFRVRQSVCPPQLKVDLFNCAAAQEMIRHFPGNQTVRVSPAQQLATDWVELTMDLPSAHPTGFRTRYTDSGHLVVEVNDAFTSPDLAGKRIAIDPGHGGPDTGAVGPTGLTEKEVNLSISLTLRERLETAGAEVVLTRYTDTAVTPGSDTSGELEARVQVSEAARADVFVSIHNNAVGSGDPRRAAGTETYYWTPMSHLLAANLQHELVGAMGTRDRFVSWQRFYVLRSFDCPRALVECAFMSNPEEEKKLKDPAFLAKAAHGILEGLRSYFKVAVQPPGVPGTVPMQVFPSPLIGPGPQG